MRILGIFLSDIQTYTQPTIIPFSESKTIVSGGNDKGKSILKKALGLFAGIYSNSDLEGLINYNRESATVGLFLSNRTYLMAYLTTKSIEYYLLTWQLDIMLKKWMEFSEEIPLYLGWVSVPGEEICINLAESNVNVLVNTSAGTNTQIIQTISKVPDIDNRIDNLNSALAEAKEVSKLIAIEKRSLETSCNMMKYDTRRLGGYLNIYQDYYNLLKVLKEVTDVFYLSCDIRENVLAYVSIKYREILIMVRLSSDIIKQMRSLYKIRTLKEKVSYISDLGLIEDTLSKRGRLYNSKERLDNLSVITLFGNLVNNLQNTNNLLLSREKLKRLRYKFDVSLVMMQDLLEIISALRDRCGLCNRRNSLIINKDINTLQWLCGMVYLIKYRVKLKLSLHNVLYLLNIVDILKIMSDIYSNIQKKGIVQVEKDKFGVCPLCGSEIKHNSHSHTNDTTCINTKEVDNSV